MSDLDPRSYSPAELRKMLEEPSHAGRTERRRGVALLHLLAPGVVALGLFVLVWQLASVHYAPFFPSIGAILRELAGNLSMFGFDVVVTLEEVAIGLAASFAVAFVLAVVMVHVSVIERAVMPLAVILNVTPIVAVAPGLTFIFGIGAMPRYIVTALIVFFPLLINSLVGLRSVDPEALEVLLTLHASRREILWHLRVPSSLPLLFVAARICFPLATIGAVVAEFSASGGNAGLGTAIEIAITSNDWAAIYASIFCLAVMGLVLTFLVTLAERRLLAFHPTARSANAALRGR